MRLSDIIAYLGRDIEDAITIGTIKREELPKQITEVLGNDNSSIVNALIIDVIKNGMDKEYIQFSKEVFKALVDLRNWNYKRIYNSDEALKNREELKNAFNKLFDIYFEELKNKDCKSNIEFSENTPISKKRLYEFVNSRSQEYRDSTDIKRIVIDYMAGQTDKFFLRECANNLDLRFA